MSSIQVISLEIRIQFMANWTLLSTVADCSPIAIQIKMTLINVNGGLCKDFTFKPFFSFFLVGAAIQCSSKQAQEIYLNSFRTKYKARWVHIFWEVSLMSDNLPAGHASVGKFTDKANVQTDFPISLANTKMKENWQKTIPSDTISELQKMVPILMTLVLILIRHVGLRSSHVFYFLNTIFPS